MTKILPEPKAASYRANLSSVFSIEVSNVPPGVTLEKRFRRFSLGILT
jgi:hypothetical protein